MANVTGADTVMQNWRQYSDAARAAGFQAALAAADWVQQEARVNAPWNDVTGEARGQLNATAAVIGPRPSNPMPPIVNLARGGFPSDDAIVVVLSGDSDHSGYLELSHGGAYEVVWPTVLQLAPGVIRLISDAVIEGRWGG